MRCRVSWARCWSADWVSRTNRATNAGCEEVAMAVRRRRSSWAVAEVHRAHLFHGMSVEDEQGLQIEPLLRTDWITASSRAQVGSHPDAGSRIDPPATPKPDRSDPRRGVGQASC